MSRPQNNLNLTLSLKIAYFLTQSYQSILGHPSFERYHNPKISPKMSQVKQKLSQNQMSEVKVNQKMKVVLLHEQTPKHFNPSPTPKIAHMAPKIKKKYSKSSQNQMSELKKKNKENESPLSETPLKYEIRIHCKKVHSIE